MAKISAFTRRAFTFPETAGKGSAEVATLLPTLNSLSPGSFHPLLPGLWRWLSRNEGPHSPTNAYLLERDGAYWLIDPPSDLTPELIQEFVGPYPVSRILITHWQAEHAAGIVHFPQARVSVSAGDAIFAPGIRALDSLVQPWPEPWDWETRGNFPGHLAGAINERLLTHSVRVETLTEGANPDGLSVIATPGHGKHAITLIVEIDGEPVGFCGDLIYGDGQLWNWFDCDWDYGPETGQRTLQHSAQRLASLQLSRLFPAHGDPIEQPTAALEKLIQRLQDALCPADMPAAPALNFPDTDSPVPGFRQLSPHLYQWKTGNTAVLTSDEGPAVVIDDGLCLWLPLEERRQKHDAIFQELKNKLGITHIEWIFPTHYHGDHVDGINRLAASEGAQVIALESIAGPMERPQDYNLACALPWYGTGETQVRIDRKVPENFILPWQNFVLQFFHLGGQTAYHQGIQVRVDGMNVLFAGDAWWGTSTTPGAVLCWNETTPDTQGWMFAIDRMIERAPDLLICGHGSAIRNPLPLLREAKVRWMEKWERLRCLNPRTSPELFFNPYTDRESDLGTLRK